ncbi:MAG TPA: NAD-dependent epimerase/dehydratase family protein [Flavobacterium sp.]|jgi:nucleoside-diphosphate-sugar epimerase
MVLVTGATGFVGSHLLMALLEKEVPIRALYRNEKKIQKVTSVFSAYNKAHLFDKIEWIQADITDIPALEIAFKNVAYVYHVAAHVSFEPREEQQLRKVNIEGTANIVNLSLANSIKKLCFVSSIAALGDLRSDEKIITETTEWNPEKYHSDYAISKYGAEMEIWRGQQEGLNAVIVNPGVILGPYFWEEGSGKIIAEVANKLPFYTKGTTGFVGINDLVKVMIALMESNSKSEKFIVISENVVFQDLIATIAKELKVPSPKTHAKKWMTEIVWRLDWLYAHLLFKNRKLSKAMAQSLHSQDLYSNEKIRKTLNFTFEPITTVIQSICKCYTNS